MNRKLLILLGVVTAGLFVAGIASASYLGTLGVGIVLSSSTPNAYTSSTTIPFALTFSQTSTFTGNINASGTSNFATLQAAGVAVLTTSTGLTASNFAANTVPSIATSSKGVYDMAPSSTDDIVMLYTETATTLKQVDCINDNASGNTATFNITWGTNRNSTTSNAFTSGYACTATTTIATNAINGSTTIAAGSIIRAVFSAASSTGIFIDIKY